MNRYAETVSALRCQDNMEFSCTEFSEALQTRLPDLGHAVDGCEVFDEEEFVLYCDGMILSVCYAEADDDYDVLIATETPENTGDVAEMDKQRLLLCATATRVICELLDVESVSWHHGDQYFVTDTTRKFSPLETGQRAREKMRSSAMAALASLKDLARPTGTNPLNALIKQHFPSEQDIALDTKKVA